MESREEDYGVINIINIKIISSIVFHIIVFDIESQDQDYEVKDFSDNCLRRKTWKYLKWNYFRWERITPGSGRCSPSTRMAGDMEKKYLPRLNSCLEKLLLPNFPIPYLPRPRTNVWESESITDFKTFPFNTCWGRGKIFQNYMLTFHIFQGHGKI